MSSPAFPNLSVELEIIEAGSRFILGVDEVGRGAIAGPVGVGVTLIDSKSSSFFEPWPRQLRDSKLVSAKVRETLVPNLTDWVAGFAVGYASAQEIDSNGIVHALATAASRAIEQLLESPSLRAQIARDGATILLDGSHNWLLGKAGGLPVVSRIKADRDCVSVAAASIFAKVARDSLMVELALKYPGFGFEGHKGYAAASHIAAVRELGPSLAHRVSWLTKILA